MKKNLLTILSLICLLTFGACNNSDKKEDAKTAKPAAAAAGKVLPNYRYVDIDSILKKYNLAADYNEEMLRMQSNLENEARRHENSIKSFAGSMESKYKNNQYTEQTFNADQSKLQQMQNNAQAQMDQLQRSSAEAALKANNVVMDSINNFIDHYVTSHHYDAILLKSATLYIDPALDITDEVVEGLNARYNKVKK